MGQNAAKAAAAGTACDLREMLSGREANPEIHQDATARQDRLISVAMKNSRARYEISLRTFKDGCRRVVLALREQNGRGVFRTTGPTIVFGPDEIEAIRELLDAADLAAREEGARS